jgi:DNA-binding MarR family transcriptional regulator
MEVDMTLSISLKQARVYFVVKALGPIGPTKIGNELGYRYDIGATITNRQLKRLCELGLIRRREINKRIVFYEVAGPTPPFHVRSEDLEADPIYIRYSYAQN